MNEPKKIIWEKWIDPLQIKNRESENVPEFMSEKEYEESDVKTKLITIKPVAFTTFGLIPVQPQSDPDKAFDFWMGHTNFNLGEKAKKRIAQCRGVELLDIYTPYRFRISVGKAFTFTEVRSAISNALLLNSEIKQSEEWIPTLDAKVKDTVLQKVKELSGSNKYWILYVLPNGEFEISLPKDFKKFQENKNIYEGSRSLGGGFIITSEFNSVYNQSQDKDKIVG